jgi:hypothetical protein
MFSSLPSVSDKSNECHLAAKSTGRILLEPCPPWGMIGDWRLSIGFDLSDVKIGVRICRMIVTGNVSQVHYDRFRAYVLADIRCDCGTKIEQYKITGDATQGLSCGCHVREPHGSVAEIYGLSQVS